ncbi:hypothetical protein [Fretibacter rubidus]|uniref:hypothetical protein n=1 Tax=Fretibacter rubidus TaxID=570162 RepID=UPI00352A407F
MPKMTFIRPLLILALTGGSATVACAANPDMAASDEPVKTAFESADVDQNGMLNRGEFIAYVEAKAAEGDEAHAALVATGDYDLAFAERDLNADGALNKGELGEVDDSWDDGTSETDDEMDYKSETPPQE